MNCKLILILISSLAFACNDAENHNAREAAAAAPKSPGDSLYEVVDKLHIEGMAKTGKLRTAIAQVKRSLDSLGKLPAKKIDKDYQKSLTGLQEDLNYADFSMFNWMTEFKDTLKDAGLRVKYLQAEKEKVTKVRDNILIGLKRADSLLKR
jgi:uncharacterized membrane-anchored protein YjiN (DUF445 family)